MNARSTSRLASWLGRILAWLVPSVVAAVWSASVVGLLDGHAGTHDPLQTVAAAGFTSFLLIPAGLVAAAVVRLLWRAWRPDALCAALIEETGGAPRLAAWIAYLLLAGWAIAAATFNIVRLLMNATGARTVIALAAAILVTLVAAALVIVSRPAVDLLARPLRALDGTAHRRRGRGLLTPQVIAMFTAASLSALLLVAWFVSIRRRIGHLEIDFAYYLLLFAGLVAALHMLWRLARGRRALAVAMGALSTALVVALAGAALYVRHARPYPMIEVWANTELAGNAIDFLYDIRALRREVRIREFGPVEQPGAAHPDVVLITIDTLRADHTSMYGGPETMPELAGLAKQGTVFEWAFAPSNVTRRSLPAIATGLHPTRIRGRVAGWALRLDPRHVLVAERFRAAGYETAGFFCCGSHFGPEHRLGLIRGIDHLEIEKDGAVLAEMAKRWLVERAARAPDRPMFMWLHFIDPHLWEETYPAKKYGGNVSRRYNKSLTDTDGHLGTLLSVLWTEKSKRRPIIAITADHGESLGEHGFPTHATSLYNAEIRVPLVIAGPGVKKQRIAQPVSAVQVAPTLLDLAGFVPPGPPQMDHETLGPLVRGEVADSRDHGEVYAAMIKDRSIGRNMRALIKGRYKYIEKDGAAHAELYDVVADPDEKKNIATTKPAVFKRMRKRLGELRRELGQDPF